MEPIKEGEEQRNDTPLTLVLEPDPESQREKRSIAALVADSLGRPGEVCTVRTGRLITSLFG